MKIISYKKKNNNIYEVTLSNKEKINLFDDVILKFELLLTPEIDDNKFKEIINYNNKIEAYNLALKFILAKLRTEKEVQTKLKKYDNDTKNYVIDRLYKEGYLNKENYIKAYVNDAVNLKLIGENKIKYELKRLGFADILIINYLETIDRAVWIEKIEKYIKKKIEVNDKLSTNALKNKIIVDLINRGFNKNDIILVLEETNFPNDNLVYQKEYEKLKNKLSKKYSGEQLEYYIKMNLLKKGFKVN